METITDVLFWTSHFVTHVPPSGNSGPVIELLRRLIMGTYKSVLHFLQPPPPSVNGGPLDPPNYRFLRD